MEKRGRIATWAWLTMPLVFAVFQRHLVDFSAFIDGLNAFLDK
jgi:hypothetical protein